MSTTAGSIERGTAAPGADAVAGLHSLLFLAGGGLLVAAAFATGAFEALGFARPTTSGLLPLLAAVALLAGLPHGALDPWITYRRGDWRGVAGFLRWHALYIAIAGAVVAFFYLAPALALFGFLAISVVHFADDWNGEEEGFAGLPRGLRIVAASAIVVVPAVAHPRAVAEIFAAMTLTQPPAGDIDLPYGIMLPTIWAVTGIVGAALIVDRRAGAEIGMVVALAVALPPLGFFLAYFAGLHSPRHMLRERDAVPGGRHLAGVALYTLLALALCVGVTLWVFGGEVAGLVDDADGEILRAVFIGLAALTVPHVILVEGLTPSSDASPASDHKTERDGHESG